MTMAPQTAPGEVIVIGAGVGGLSAAAFLARAGVPVQVLEAHVYPGGCAGTFFHQGYRFDAGATLVGGFGPGAPLDRVGQALGIRWPVHLDPVAMQVHLPQGLRVTRWADGPKWLAEVAAHFGPSALSFWQWQMETADALWALMSSMPPWPPDSPAHLVRLARQGMAWLGRLSPARWPGLLRDALGKAGSRLPHHPAHRLLVDAQLLISAQTTADHANALFAAAALDLARLGVGHLPGGVGRVARELAASVVRHGGQVHLRQEVTRVARQGSGWRITTRRGLSLEASHVIFNLPPWNAARLLGDDAPPRLRRLPPRPQDGWGAFTLYLGVDEGVVPADLPLHHQVVQGEPLGEGRSLFLSISPAWDQDRAPAGKRAITLSTHTALAPWWALFHQDREAYEARKQAYTRDLLAQAERVLPGLAEAAHLVLPGTPITFQRFTRRAWGWVGGWPQTHLLRGWSPTLGRGRWLVWDTIFPGQSLPAVALGGLGVASRLLAAPRGAALPAPRLPVEPG